jgi:predicted PurR-regulated permease PerM
MQASTPPQTVTPPATKAPVFSMVGPDGKPLTFTIPQGKADLKEILAQRDQISEQLTNVSSRRSELAEELANTPEQAARAGLEDRLRLLDQRILQLETDLATTGRQLESAPGNLLASAQAENHADSDEQFVDGAVSSGFSVFAFMAVVLFFMRRRWKKSAGPRPNQLPSDTAQRMERLEHGMDAIAIEIERISEGQRFVTKLLSESQQPQLVTPQREKDGR